MARVTETPPAARLPALSAASIVLTRSRPVGEPVADRRAQGGQAARARNDGHARRPRRRVERADAADEFAPVREIEIMGARGDAGLGEAIVDLLERPRRVDDEPRPLLAQALLARQRQRPQRELRMARAKGLPPWPRCAPRRSPG